MMRHPIRVECYAGSRADESPRSVTIDGRKHLVARLLGESVEESVVTKTRTHRYRVLTSDGMLLEILRDSGGEWFLAANQSPDQVDSE
jgi:hypothetical protein